MEANADKRVVESLCQMAEPPFDGEPWEWMDQHVRLDDTGPKPGPYRSDRVPVVKIFYKYATSKRTRRLTVITSAQSTKTQNLLNFFAWCLKNSPGPTMWIMAVADAVTDFVKQRFRPFIELCPILNPMMPRSRAGDTKGLMQFSTMDVMFRGSNSRARLKSDPVKRIICDERSDWKRGAIGTVRKRLRTFYDAIEISVGTAGEVNDELHRDFIEGSQTFIHFNCPECGHSQPFRFSRDATPYYSEPRDHGGLRWETNDTTKPKGRWNLDEVAKTVYYECENADCLARFTTRDRPRLLATLHEHHRNPNTLPKHVSLHWWTMYMPWASCEWSEIAIEFLKALAAKKRGDIEPLKTFVQETLGEPWKPPTVEAKATIYQCVAPYKMRQLSGQENTVLVLTFDVQHGYIVYLIREWFVGVGSRLLDCGTVADQVDLHAKALEWKIEPQCVGGDCNYRAPDVKAWCAEYGWLPLLGDDAKEFAVMMKNPATGKMESSRTYVKATNVDAKLGKSGPAEFIDRYNWCNDHYKDMLYLYWIPGELGQWQVPQDIPKRYVTELSCTLREEETHADETVSYKWVEHGRHDLADCELMQLVMADLGELMVED